MVGGWILFSPHPLQHLIFITFDDGFLDHCEVMTTHWSFDLHVSNNYQCWPSFHVPAAHVDVIFGD